MRAVENALGITIPDNARILLFSLMIGALIAYLRQSGGVTALVDSLVNSGLASNSRRASLLTSGVGGVIFVDLRDRYGKTQVVFAPEGGNELLEEAGRWLILDVQRGTQRRVLRFRL